MTITLSREHLLVGFVWGVFVQWFVLALLLLRYKLKHPDGYYKTGWNYSEQTFWFRVWGFGLKIRDVGRWGFTFSERNGHKNFIMLRGRIIKMLWP